MRLHRAIILLALAGLLAPALRAEPTRSTPPAPDETIDIMTVSPATLGGEDTRTLSARAHAAYSEKRYEDAARAYILALRKSPGDSGSLYNLACCYGLLGAPEKAAEFLEAAYRAGFKDLGHAKNDGDFESVRAHETFVSVMKKLEEAAEKRKKGLGKLLEVVAPVVGTVRVIEPTIPMKWYERYPLVIGLHGYGDNSENFASLFVRRGLDQPFLFVAVQAPYASHGGSRIGFSWGFATEGGDTRMGNTSHALTETLVLKVLETVKRHYRVDERKVFLMGFSQGAGQAFSIGMKHPEKFAGVIPIGGWLDSGEHAPNAVRRAAKDGLFLICHSPQDRVVEWNSCEQAKTFLEENEIAHAVLSYPGGHSLPVGLVKAVAAWIAKPGPTAPELPAKPKAPPVVEKE